MIDTARLEAFSDGVLAIAITLLVIEVRPPELEEGETLLHGVLAQWPSYAAYATSFLVIGIMWLNHHNLFQLIGRVDHALLVYNLALLGFIAFVPFPTALVADHLTDGGGRTATAIYGGLFLLTAITFNLLWRHASSDRRLIDEGAPQATVDAITKAYSIGPLTYLVALLVAFLSPVGSLALHAGIALFFLLPGERAARMLTRRRT